MKNGTVLFVSHDTGAVKNLCNRVIWLEKGKLLEQGNPKEVCELYLQAFYEAQQGKSTATKLKIADKIKPVSFQDQRQDFINASNLRNDLKIFVFDHDSSAFGQGGAQITNVEFLNAKGEPLNWVVGGEVVTLKIYAQIHQDLENPIIGFSIKDHRGQTLFGDNTYLTYSDSQLFCESETIVDAEFRFVMPVLPSGDYSVGAAIATGTQEEHIQHHWLHDALIFKSEASSVATGLMGIPMQEIKLTTRND